MYIKKLEYFQSNYKEGDLINGISTKVMAHMPVGSPCAVSLSRSSYRSSRLSKSKINTDLQKLVSAGNVDEINKNLKKIFDTFYILILFNTNCDNSDYTVGSLGSSSFHYVEKKPLIYDAYSSTSLEEAGQIANDMSHANHKFVSEIIDQLKEVRFINYVFNNVGLSNVKDVTYDIKSIIDSLAARYPNHVSTYHSPWSGCRTLIDTASISFYRLADVVPIFNRRKLEGLCMEVLLINSETDKDKIMKQEMSMTYRFLFSKYRENIFSIDGQTIKRPNDHSVSDVAKALYSRFKSYVPNDTTEKKVKRSKKVGGSKTCVES